MLQDAGSCCCSVPEALLSHDRQLSWVLFQRHWIPGQAWLQDAALENAEQLGEVYMRTSLSSRLLKPPNTYITLQDRGERRRWRAAGKHGDKREGTQEVR